MRVAQTLSSGVMIRQDFRDSTRFVMFETDFAGWEYATEGGTAFVVNFKGLYLGITCAHCRGSFNWSQLAISDEKFGRNIAGFDAVYTPSSAESGTEETEVLDIAVVRFSKDINGAFFRDGAYVIDGGTIAQSDVGDRLHVNGVINELSEIQEERIAPVFALLEFTDTGPAPSDPTLREATGQFSDIEFKSISGFSGSPVFNITKQKLSGVVVRGGIFSNVVRVWYVDIFDIHKILDSIGTGVLRADYKKIVKTRIR